MKSSCRQAQSHAAGIWIMTMRTGMGDNYYALGAVYDPMATGACAQNMDILVQAMEAEEGCAPAHWKAAIQKAIDWVIHLIEKENGALQAFLHSAGAGRF